MSEIRAHHEQPWSGSYAGNTEEHIKATVQDGATYHLLVMSYARSRLEFELKTEMQMK